MILPLIPHHRPVLHRLSEGGSHGTFFASNREVKQKRRGVMVTAIGTREYSDAAKNACSIEDMMNGGTSEAYQ